MKTFYFFAPVGKQTIFFQKIPDPPCISNGPSLMLFFFVLTFKFLYKISKLIKSNTFFKSMLYTLHYYMIIIYIFMPVSPHSHE